MAETIIVARLNDRVQPIHRGELYEDPLDGWLQERRWGEVSGGGSQLGSEGEIQYCEIEIALTSADPAVLDAIAAKLEELGAPKGSAVLGSAGDERSLGVTEGLAVYLNGTDLPPATYQNSDVNVVYRELNRLLEGEGKIHSYWQGPRETALYMYGASFPRMQAAISGFLSSYPLCERARVVQIA